MSLLKSIFGSSEKQSTIVNKINWIPLITIEQLDDIVIESKDNLVIIFKHSTRCSVSRMVLKEFENDYNLENKALPYFLDLLEHRDISNEIASRFSIIHQSPQLIIIKNGISVYNASHSDIDATIVLNY